MDTRAALLKAIIDEPGDDTHRLVFADWLDEQGRGEWAALIRAQCALHPLIAPADDPYVDPRLLPLRSLTLGARREILGTLGALMMEEEELHPVPPAPRLFAWKVRRGMIEYVEVWGEDGVRRFIAISALLFAQAPLVDLVLRTYWPVESSYDNYSPIHPGTLEALLNLPELSRLRNLDLRGTSLHGQFDFLLSRARRLAKARIWVDEASYQTVNMASPQEAIAALGERLVIRPAHASNTWDVPF